LDNRSIHHTEELQQKINTAGFRLLFLSPYNPMLNPIEEVIGDIKRQIRRFLCSEFRPQVLRIQAFLWSQKTQVRRGLLDEMLQ
jgi:transposase